LARGLAAGGARVTVCGPSATNERFRFDSLAPAGSSAGTVEFAPVEISHGAHPSDARAVSALRRTLTAVAPDVVHAHGLRAGLVSSLARRGRAGVAAPLVVTLHNAVIARGLRGGVSRVAERVVARSANVVLGASADLVATALAAGAVDARLGPVVAPELP